MLARACYAATTTTNDNDNGNNSTTNNDTTINHINTINTIVAPTLLRGRGGIDESGVRKGRFSKAGFSNLCVIIMSLLLNPPFA